jgi:anti-sigma factor RsiW
MENDMTSEPTNGPSDDQLADLARLADGTLPAERRAEVEAQVAASPELSRILRSQAVTLEALGRAAADTGAPARLRADIERRRAGRRKSRVGSRLVSARAAVVSAGAAVALALALVLPGALSGGLSVSDAAAFAVKPPTQGAPAVGPGTPQLLQAKVDDVPFPNYAKKFGWKPVGARTDHRSGRDALTVFYRKDGRTIAYTIVSGDALDRPSDARATKRGGVEYRTFRVNGRTVVTWERGGRTCVLSSPAVPPSTLVGLADWRGKGAIPF